jgi:hypothetical protein
VINIGADIGALGAAAELIIHIPVAVLMVGFTALILFLEVVVSAARSGRLSRTVLALTFIGMAGSVVAMLVSYAKG